MITLEDIQLAQRRLRGVAVRTPLLPWHGRGGAAQLYLKPESLQPTGAFKLRGAYNKIVSLSPEEQGRGVITYSSGNHAIAVAYAGRTLGVRAVVVMPAGAPRVKLERTAGLGAEVVTVGAGSNERRRRAEELAAEHGYVMVPPFDDELVMAGQGTLGLEILEDLPDAGLVLVPVSGGGLISGVAAALKLSRPDTCVVGVEPELAADAQASLRAGELASFPAEQTSKTIADGLRVQRLGELTWPHVQRFVDDIVTVTEEQIREAMRVVVSEARLVVEPSGAVSLAAWLFHQGELPAAGPAVVVISGGNVERALLLDVLSGTAGTAD